MSHYVSRRERASSIVVSERTGVTQLCIQYSHAPDIAFASNMASVESYITSSADHQDAVFRLIQYSAKLLGSLQWTAAEALCTRAPSTFHAS